MPWSEEDVIQALYIAAQDGTDEAYDWICSKNETPTELLSDIYWKGPSVYIKYKIVGHENVSEDILMNVVKRTVNTKLLIEVLKSPKITREIFHKIATKKKTGGRLFFGSYEFERELMWRDHEFPSWVTEEISKLKDIRDVIE